MQIYKLSRLINKTYYKGYLAGPSGCWQLEQVPSDSFHHIRFSISQLCFESSGHFRCCTGAYTFAKFIYFGKCEFEKEFDKAALVQ